MLWTIEVRTPGSNAKPEKYRHMEMVNPVDKGGPLIAVQRIIGESRILRLAHAEVNFCDDGLLIRGLEQCSNNAFVRREWTCTPESRIHEITGDVYPLTIIKARYMGVYEGGRFLALCADPDMIDPDIVGDDTACMEFFRCYGDYVGRGDSPDEAAADLKRIIVETGISLDELERKYGGR